MNRIALVVVLASVLGVTSRAQEQRDLADVLGVTHVDGKYYFTHGDFLNEGADQVLATGTRVIKLYMTGRDPERYSWNSNWPEAKTLVEMAQLPQFRSLFSKPFKTYIITAYALGHKDHYWTTSTPPDELADEAQQFYDLTKYLLTTYRGTGKTFVFQHWEGDWSLRDMDGHIYDPKFTPPQSSIDGMIKWLNARQAGIRKAREEVRDTDVHVYGATEANRVVDSMHGRPGVANSVLPNTTVDLVSYSSWDSQGDEKLFAQAIEFLGSHLPKTAAFGQNTHSVYVGEFGGPENGGGEKHDGPARVNSHINNVMKVTRDAGMPWAVYWELYCNELVLNATPPVNGKNDAVKGHWLIKPDGKPGIAWHRVRELIFASEPQRASADEIKKSLSASDKEPATANVGEYLEVTLRPNGSGGFEVHLFGDDPTTIGIEAAANAPLAAKTDDGKWTPISMDDQGEPVNFDWSQPHTFGGRLDSADGTFATASFYVDGKYAGSWLYRTASKSPEALKLDGSFECDAVKVYAK